MPLARKKVVNSEYLLVYLTSEYLKPAIVGFSANMRVLFLEKVYFLVEK